MLGGGSMLPNLHGGNRNSMETQQHFELQDIRKRPLIKDPQSGVDQ